MANTLPPPTGTAEHNRDNTCLEEVGFRKKKSHRISFIDAREIYLKGMEGISKTPLPADFPEKISLTIGADGPDPSVIRSTGTPVPGGIGWHETLTLIERCIFRPNRYGIRCGGTCPSAWGSCFGFCDSAIGLSTWTQVVWYFSGETT